MSVFGNVVTLIENEEEQMLKIVILKKNILPFEYMISRSGSKATSSHTKKNFYHCCAYVQNATRSMSQPFNHTWGVNVCHHNIFSPNCHSTDTGLKKVEFIQI